MRQKNIETITLVLLWQIISNISLSRSEAAFLDEIQTKVSRVFHFVIHSHLYSFAWYFYFFKLTHTTSYSFYSSVTVHCRGERMETWQKTIPPSLWFKKSIQKSQVWELSKLYPETSMFMNSASVQNSWQLSSEAQLFWTKLNMDPALTAFPCER